MTGTENEQEFHWSAEMEGSQGVSPWPTGRWPVERVMLVLASVPAVVALLLLLAGWLSPGPAAETASAPQLGLSAAHIAPPAVQADLVPAYITVRNAGSSPDRLVAASTPWADSVSLVSSTGTSWIDIPPRSSVALHAGGPRLVLTGLRRTPRLGDTIQLDLDFDRSGTIHVFAPVGPANSLTVSDVMNAMKYMDRLPPATT
ncbi:copper chaperone PCu(A)C [Streptomyces canus]|uniref:copper chaperone PCu(A)C n=1 Tax=Streptomyces canus TaxID=58343 RepID=UPI00324D06CA